jgi:hypothetical protein
MSIDFEPGRQRYRVRWREAGRQHCRRFCRARRGRGLRRIARAAGAERAARRSGGAGARRRRRLSLRHGGRPALAVRVPPVRRLAHHAPRLRKPERRRRDAPDGDRAGAARRGPRVARDLRGVLDRAARVQAPVRDRRDAAGLRHAGPQAAAAVVRRAAPGGDRRGPRARLARGDGRVGRRRRTQCQDGQQCAHVPVDDAR